MLIGDVRFMKKIIIVSVSIICLCLSSCTKFQKGIQYNVSAQTEYILSYEVYNAREHYLFVLKSRSQILAEYKNENGDFEEISVILDDAVQELMLPHIEEILDKSANEFEGSVPITDFWCVKLCYNGIEVIYDYSVSECIAANVLLEQIIGCCTFNSTDKEALQPFAIQQRNFMEQLQR